jgi:hypothetical protein
VTDLFGGIPAEFTILVPLAITAGVDLYLTLLLIGLAPLTGLWADLPGALGDLASPGVLIIGGCFYVLEFVAERSPIVGLAWNGFHSLIRPLAGALLALLLLDGRPLDVVAVGALLAGLLASLTHVVRTGWGVLAWMGSSPHPNRIIVAIFEDVLVLGAIVLLLDAPRWALVASTLVLLAGLRAGGSQFRAFTFAFRLAISRVWSGHARRRWQGPNDLPEWLHGALGAHPGTSGTGVRGYPAGGHRLPGAPVFVTGWVVVGSDARIFAFQKPRQIGSVDLTPLKAVAVIDRSFFRGVTLEGAATSSHLYFELGGPEPESLAYEFLDPDGGRNQGPDPG